MKLILGLVGLWAALAVAPDQKEFLFAPWRTSESDLVMVENYR